jgi:hypothetical protein
MLDWPLHSQTSPTWTPLKLTTVLPEVTDSVLKDALAGMLAKSTRHLPSLPAVVDTL